MLFIYFISSLSSYACGIFYLLSINLQHDSNLPRTGNFCHEEMTLYMITRENKSLGNLMSSVVLAHSSSDHAPADGLGMLQLQVTSLGQLILLM